MMDTPEAPLPAASEPQNAPPNEAELAVQRSEQGRIEWRKKQARLAEQTRLARQQLVEEVARRRIFEHLHEEIGTAPEKFPETYDWVAKSYDNGRFFLRNIGLFYEVSPDLSILVFHLRQEWIRQYGLTTVAELTLLDQAMLAYFQVLRLNKTVASMFSIIENTLFYPEEPHVKIKQRRGLGADFDGFVAEDAIRQLQDRLMPLIERFNVMFLRNLRALRELTGGPVNITISQAGQVNVGQQQVNLHAGNGRAENPPGSRPTCPVEQNMPAAPEIAADPEDRPVP